MGLFSKKGSASTPKEKTEAQVAAEQKRYDKEVKKAIRQANNPNYQAKQFTDAAKQFENSRMAENEKSKKLAWRITFGSCFLTSLAIVAIVGLTPLKETVPVIHRVDTSTGKVDVVNVLKDAQAGYGEVVDKYNLAKYVEYREGYDWFTVQTTFNNAMLMSNNDERNRLNNLYQSVAAPYKVYGQKSRVIIKVNNVSFIGNYQAQVRYEKITEPANGGNFSQAMGAVEPAPKVERYIATISYEYINAPKKEEERYVNPLGFTTVSYRTDLETGL